MTPFANYADLAVIVLALVASAVLAVLFHVRVARPLLAKGKSWAILVSRLGGPAFFLAAVVLVKAVFRIEPSLDLYLDAAFLFFAFVLVFRIADAAVLVLYASRRKPYPLPNVLRGLIVAVVYLSLLFAILKNVLHVNIGTFLTGSAILTAVIGLALQGVLSNILSGMSLHFTHAFSRGDWVGIGSLEGVVMDTNWRETRILDRASNIVVIPNNVVAAEKVVNFSRPDKRTALLLNLKASAQAPAAEVLEALYEAAIDCPHVLDEPKPKPYVRSYDETGITYAIKHWVDDFGLKDIILTDIGRLAWYKLRRRGIEVAVSWPDRVRELGEAIEGAKTAGRRPDETPAFVRAAPAEEEILQTASYLRESSFLRFPQGEQNGRLMVPDEELLELAKRAKRSAYTRDEVLCRQGDKGVSCFLVVRGRIHGRIAYEEDGRRFVTEFEVGPGGLFGEMSVFTGMPRTATGTVAEESQIIEILADDFGRLLARNLGIAESIAEMISARNAQNKAFLLKIKELSAQEVEASADKHSVLAYLKKFVAGLWK
jgi:small-conductance mechanosensitive channel/CRP-like cAMP-binding protein